MGMAGYSFGERYCQVEVDISEVTEGLNEFNVRTKRALWKYLQNDACPMLKTHMQHEHPWQNRTRTAELGLDARVVKSGNMKRDDYSLGIELSHSAYNDRGQPYGEYLEYVSPEGLGVKNPRRGMRRNAAYPILQPTIEKYGSKVVEDMQGIVDMYG